MGEVVGMDGGRNMRKDTSDAERTRDVLRRRLERIPPQRGNSGLSNVRKNGAGSLHDLGNAYTVGRIVSVKFYRYKIIE